MVSISMTLNVFDVLMWDGPSTTISQIMRKALL